MISYYQKHSVHEELQPISQPPVERGWVYGARLSEHELHEITDTYGLDPNIVGDVRDAHELPRVEASAGALYVFIRSIQRSRRGEILTVPLLLVAKGSLYMTLSTAEPISPHQIAAGADIEHTPSLLLGTIAAVVADFEDLMQHTSRYIKDTSRRLRTHDVNNKDFIRFVTIEDNLNEYSTNLSGILAVIDRLREGKHAQIRERDREVIDDIDLHIRQLLVFGDSLAQSVTSIRNAYSTIANNTLNQRMKTLTVLTLLVALPNVFYGMYGMNVALPFADQPWAYWVVVVFTLALIVVVYAIARRLKVF